MVALRKSVALKILFLRRDDGFGLGVPIDFQHQNPHGAGVWKAE